jgi:hypothetical protein
MKQLGHASQIIPLLHPQEEGKTPSEEETSALPAVLSRQFSHSDGIRGFFAVYLTSPESLTVDEVPVILAEAVKNADKKVMVPLACMNVIMPTAMSSIHEDAELKECASKTAVNGIKILRLLKGDSSVTMNCKAIMSVCRGAGEGSEDLIEVSLAAALLCLDVSFAFPNTIFILNRHLHSLHISSGINSLSVTGMQTSRRKTSLWRYLSFADVTL